MQPARYFYLCYLRVVSKLLLEPERADVSRAECPDLVEPGVDEPGELGSVAIGRLPLQVPSDGHVLANAEAI